jgi:hypothetical protein
MFLRNVAELLPYYTTVDDLQLVSKGIMMREMLTNSNFDRLNIKLSQSICHFALYGSVHISESVTVVCKRRHQDDCFGLEWLACFQ